MNLGRRDEKDSITFGLDNKLLALLERLLCSMPAATNPDNERKLDGILAALSDIKKDIQKMAMEMEALVQQVAETQGVMRSAHKLIQGFAAALAAAGTDPAKLAALTADLKADEDALADGMIANPLPGEVVTPV